MVRMLSKLKNLCKRIWKVLKVSVLVVVALALLIIPFYFTYTFGQLSACNALLRRNPGTRRYGLYCEHTSMGVLVKSTIYRKTLLNITTDESPLGDW